MSIDLLMILIVRLMFFRALFFNVFLIDAIICFINFESLQNPMDSMAITPGESQALSKTLAPFTPLDTCKIDTACSTLQPFVGNHNCHLGLGASSIIRRGGGPMGYGVWGCRPQMYIPWGMGYGGLAELPKPDPPCRTGKLVIDPGISQYPATPSPPGEGRVRMPKWKVGCKKYGNGVDSNRV